MVWSTVEKQLLGSYRPSERFWTHNPSILFLYPSFRGLKWKRKITTTPTTNQPTNNQPTHLPVPSSVNRKTTYLNWSHLGKSAQINSKHSLYSRIQKKPIEKEWMTGYFQNYRNQKQAISKRKALCLQTYHKIPFGFWLMYSIKWTVLSVSASSEVKQ